jgi:hypothetical protein
LCRGDFSRFLAAVLRRSKYICQLQRCGIISQQDYTLWENRGQNSAACLSHHCQIFQHLRIYSADFSASWVGNTAWTEPEDGWAEGGKADRKTFVSWKLGNNGGICTTRLCQLSEPVFVNLLRSRGIDSQPGGSGTKTLFVVPARARLHKLAETIPRNRFLGSLNVYKYGRWKTFLAYLRIYLLRSPCQFVYFCLSLPTSRFFPVSLKGRGNEREFKFLTENE